jgi:hypothetical protein
VAKAEKKEERILEAFGGNFTNTSTTLVEEVVHMSHEVFIPCILSPIRHNICRRLYEQATYIPSLQHF